MKIKLAYGDETRVAVPPQGLLTIPYLKIKSN